MSRQRIAASHFSEILQNLPSDCSDNDSSDSEINPVVNAAWASVPAVESNESDTTIKLMIKLHILSCKVDQILAIAPDLRRISVGLAPDLRRISVGFVRIWRGILTLTLTLTPTSLIPRQSDEVAMKHNLCRATKL